MSSLSAQQETTSLRYFSAFSGIGGFELALQKASEGLFLAPTCVGHSEIDKYALSVYKRHFTGNKNYGDITKINTNTLPDFDLLVGGFPCQSHSALGKRAGLNDERGELFFDLARILKDKRPKYFVLENVKGLLSSNNGQAFRTILTALDEMGYGIAWGVFNAQFFASPQARERLVIIGVHGEEPLREVLRLGEDQSVQTHFEEARILSYSGLRDTITFRNTINTIPANYKGLGKYNEPVLVDYDGRLRRLTPLECERAQGFPDDWTKLDYQGKSVSDYQRYKMVGNAVCVPLFISVLRKLLEEIQKHF